MKLTHLQVAGSEIICTPTHPFYSPVKGWTAACRLRAGDILQTVNGIETRYEYYVSGSLAATLGRMNPIRYRGYVYDEETGLYYLTSRYYTPSNARWLNGDHLVSTGLGVFGVERFQYSNYNPVLTFPIIISMN